MNDAFVPYRRRIDPAAEPAFALGGLRVSPATLEIVSATGVETLEPRVMQVLVALHARANEAVTRDELSQLCWGGLIVGDDALNRSISRLRKALAAEPAVQIDTIPKVGYRLRIDAPADIPVEPGPTGAGPRHRRPSLMLGLAVAGFGALAAALVGLGGTPTWEAAGMRPLTRDGATESFPALSPNGEWLAYAGGGGFGRPRDIYLKGIGVGDSTPLALAATPADESSPAWSTDGRRLAFVRRITDEPCAIIVMSPPRGAERVVSRCRVDEATTLTWVNDDTIVFSDRDRADAPRRLKMLDVTSGRVRPITDPPASSTGDVVPVASPDGRRIAYRRTAALGSDDVFVLDLDTLTSRPLTSDGWKASGLAWSPDAKTLFINSNRRGDFGLWALDADGDAAPQRVSLGLMALGAMSADRQGRLAVQLAKMRAQLVELSPDGAGAPITEGTGIDWDPDAAADGRVVYVSELSGTSELWVARRGAPAARLTNLRGSYAHSPRWSPDARRIAFVGVTAQKSDIYVVEADGARLRRLTVDGAGKGSVAWSSRAGELLYTLRTDDGWRLRRMTLGREAAGDLPAASDAVILRRAPDGRIYVRTAGSLAVMTLDTATGRLRPTTPRIDVADREAWAVGADGVYAVRDAGTPAASLWFTSWTGTSRRVAPASTAPRPNFAVRPDGRTVILPRLLQEDADLTLLQLRQR